MPLPASPYAASKLMGEHYCRLFSSLYGLDTVSLRYFNIFGPRQNPESKYSTVIPVFIEAVATGKRPEVHWDGKQSRDFTYVDNVAEATILASQATGVGTGEIFNIALGEEHTLLDLLDHLNKIIGSNIKPDFKPKRTGDVYKTFADSSKAERLMGWKGKVNFAEGLRRTVEWFRANPP